MIHEYGMAAIRFGLGFDTDVLQIKIAGNVFNNFVGDRFRVFDKRTDQGVLESKFVILGMPPAW